jgi:hypothetical protein
MSKIKSFFQSIQKPFQGPINSIKNVAIDVHHEIIQKPFQGLSNQDLSIQIIQKPFQGLSNSIKNVAVVHMHHDQKHPSDILMHPRRLQADVPAQVAQKNVNDAYSKGFDMGGIDGLLFGSGTASVFGGMGWLVSALSNLELFEQYPEAELFSQAASRAAAAAAATSGIEAIVIGSTLADAGAAGAVLGTGAMAVMPAAVAAVAPVAVGVAEAAAAAAAAPLAPIVLSATLVTAGVALTTAAIVHYLTHKDDSMRAAGVHAVL